MPKNNCYTCACQYLSLTLSFQFFFCFASVNVQYKNDLFHIGFVYDLRCILHSAVGKLQQVHSTKRLQHKPGNEKRTEPENVLPFSHAPPAQHTYCLITFPEINLKKVIKYNKTKRYGSSEIYRFTTEMCFFFSFSKSLRFNRNLARFRFSFCVAL